MKKTLIIIILINIIILIFQLGFYVVKDVRLISDNRRKEIEKQEEEKVMIIPQWYNHYFKTYYGEVSEKEIYKAIYKFVNNSMINIYKDTKDMNQNGIENYYVSNNEKVNNEYLIESKEEFVKIAESIKKNYNENLKYESSKFDVEEYAEEDNYSKTKLIIYFNDSKSIEVTINVIIEKQDGRKNISFESFGGENEG